MTDELPTEWHCNCSKERYYNAVLSLGKKEIASLLEEGEPIEVNCQFCNSHYKFSPDELKEMLLKAAAIKPRMVSHHMQSHPGLFNIRLSPKPYTIS